MKNIVEINGRQYDTKTGKLLAKSPVNNNDAQNNARPQPTGKVMDGVSRRRPVRATIQMKTNPMTQPKPVFYAAATTAKDPTSMRGAEKSKTLLRNIVKKPQNSHYLAKPATETSNARSSISNLSKKVSGDRLKRSKQIKKADNISHFQDNQTPQANLSPSLKVRNAPNVNTAPSVVPILGRPKRTKPKNQNKEQVFAHSLASANAHLAPKIKKDKVYKRIGNSLHLSPKALAAVALSLAFITLAGFLAYQNVPSFAMKVAANKAGFSGRLPGDIPSGFAFKGPINASKGFIRLSYKSNSDNRNFSIIQKPTSWTSESLLTDYLMTSNIKYQTYHDKGLTVYIYNEGNATWVDKGIWYNITGQGALSSDQILSIAGSL